MFNPTKLLKLKPERDMFVTRHPEFVRFIEKEFGGDVQEGDQLTITYTHKDGTSESSSATLTRDDVNLVNLLARLF